MAGKSSRYRAKVKARPKEARKRGFVESTHPGKRMHTCQA